jgi:hypothetical protein
MQSKYLTYFVIVHFSTNKKMTCVTLSRKKRRKKICKISSYGLLDLQLTLCDIKMNWEVHVVSQKYKSLSLVKFFQNTWHISLLCHVSANKMMTRVTVIYIYITKKLKNLKNLSGDSQASSAKGWLSSHPHPKWWEWPL